MKMAIWPVYLIALYWSFQNRVETVRLPKKHLEAAIQCLRVYVGEGIVLQTFSVDLSNADYLGDICKYKNVNIILREINKDVQEGDSRIQECLSIKNLDYVYTEIIGNTREVLENQHPEEYSDFAKYIMGLCHADYTVDFNKLKDNGDKMIAFNCLRHCTEKFMSRIERSLNHTIYRMFRFMMAGSNPVEHEEIINNFIIQTEIVDKPDFSSLRDIDIDQITILGEPLMTRFSQVYSILYRYLSENGDSSDQNIHPKVKTGLNAITIITDEKKNLNSNLSESFTYYKSCANVECYMKAPKSVPLYKLIHDEASKEYTNIQLKEQIFYKALANSLDDDNDDDDDDNGEDGDDNGDDDDDNDDDR